MAVATGVTTVQAELLVSGLDPVFTRLGITELFSGVIIVSLVSGAAESYAEARRTRPGLRAESASRCGGAS